MAALNQFDSVNVGLRYVYEVTPLPGAQEQPRAMGTAHLASLAGNRLTGDYHNVPQLLKGTWFHRHGAYDTQRA